MKWNLIFFRLRVVHWILLEKQATARAIVNWNGCYTIAVQQRVTFPTKFTTVGYLLFWHVDNKCNHKHAKRNTSFFLSWTIAEKIVSWKLSHWIILYYVFLFGQRPNKKSHPLCFKNPGSTLRTTNSFYHWLDGQNAKSTSHTAFCLEKSNLAIAIDTVRPKDYFNELQSPL